MQENITLALQAERGILRRIRPSRQRELALSWIEALDIRPADLDRPAGTLSGGNQQKVLLARLLALSPRVLVLDEPTRGIDVGAKVEVQNLVGELADNGLSVMFISAELEEVLRVGNRVAVAAGRPHRRHHAVRGADRRLPDGPGGPARRVDGHRSEPGVSPDDRPARAANIFDVARLAGVSHQTVSRVLNDLPNVRPATRARVEQAIAQLRYSPSPAARALVTRRTRTIGLVAPGISDYGPTSIAMHFNFAARAARYNVETVSALDPTTRRRSARSSTACCGSGSTRSCSSSSTSRCSRWCAASTSASRSSPPRPRPGAARSSSRSTSTAARARPCATSPSSATPASCTSPARRTPPDAIERVRGWRDELAAQPPRDRRAACTATGRPRAATGSARELDIEPGMAVFVGNDHMAIGLLSALRERGLRVPEDVSVVGFDDVPEAALPLPAADDGAPGLRGARRADHAEGAHRGRGARQPLTEDTPLPTHLILRQSTGRSTGGTAVHAHRPRRVAGQPRRGRSGSGPPAEARGLVDGVDSDHVVDRVVTTGQRRRPVRHHRGERSELMFVRRRAVHGLVDHHAVRR